mmetsp:Transcript_20366/g.60737  ORF Transcript_20366/g.60737 Transcript_20366/m.60737 type:complete len:91 (-) Transcript_20366:13-285(-)
MRAMFLGCAAFNADIGGWDTSRVTDMSVMLQNCQSFDRDLRRWNLAALTDASLVVYGAAIRREFTNPEFHRTLQARGSGRLRRQFDPATP